MKVRNLVFLCTHGNSSAESNSDEKRSTGKKRNDMKSVNRGQLFESDYKRYDYFTGFFL